MEATQQKLQFKKEIRSAVLNIADIQQEQENDLVVSGYAVVFEQPTILFEMDGVQYKEIIDRHALDNADLTDVPFKYNHSENFLVLARTRNKTLNLRIDDKGLFVTANLANVQTGQDLYTLIKRGDIDKMSFAFTVKNDIYDSLTNTRRILAIDKLFDVSAVDTPAYDQTSISARDYFSAQEEIQRLKEREEQRKRLVLMTF